MFHSKNLNNKKNRLHEKALRIMYSIFKANFDEFLDKDSSFSMHHRNIRTLVIEIFKVLNGLSLPIMNGVLQVKLSAPYSLRNKNKVYSRNLKTVTYVIFGTQNLVKSISRNKKLFLKIKKIDSF